MRSWFPKLPRPLIGIMWVIEDHRALRAHIMPDHIGDRGAVRQILEPRDHLHINHERPFLFDCGHPAARPVLVHAGSRHAGA